MCDKVPDIFLSELSHMITYIRSLYFSVYCLNWGGLVMRFRTSASALNSSTKKNVHGHR